MYIVLDLQQISRTCLGKHEHMEQIIAIHVADKVFIFSFVSKYSNNSKNIFYMKLRIKASNSFTVNKRNSSSLIF